MVAYNNTIMSLSTKYQIFDIQKKELTSDTTDTTDESIDIDILEKIQEDGINYLISIYPNIITADIAEYTEIFDTYLQEYVINNLCDVTDEELLMKLFKGCPKIWNHLLNIVDDEDSPNLLVKYIGILNDIEDIDENESNEILKILLNTIQLDYIIVSLDSKYKTASDIEKYSLWGLIFHPDLLKPNINFEQINNKIKAIVEVCSKFDQVSQLNEIIDSIHHILKLHKNYGSGNIIGNNIIHGFSSINFLVTILMLSGELWTNFSKCHKDSIQSRQINDWISPDDNIHTKILYTYLWAIFTIYQILIIKQDGLIAKLKKVKTEIDFYKYDCDNHLESTMALPELNKREKEYESTIIIYSNILSNETIKSNVENVYNYIVEHNITLNDDILFDILFFEKFIFGIKKQSDDSYDGTVPTNIDTFIKFGLQIISVDTLTKNPTVKLYYYKFIMDIYTYNKTKNLKLFQGENCDILTNIIKFYNSINILEFYDENKYKTHYEMLENITNIINDYKEAKISYNTDNNYLIRKLLSRLNSIYDELIDGFSAIDTIGKSNIETPINKIRLMAREIKKNKILINNLINNIKIANILLLSLLIEPIAKQSEALIISPNYISTIKDENFSHIITNLCSGLSLLIKYDVVNDIVYKELAQSSIKIKIICRFIITCIKLLLDDARSINDLTFHKDIFSQFITNVDSNNKPVVLRHIFEKNTLLLDVQQIVSTIEQNKEFDYSSIDDIPSEFLDPIYANLIETPIMIPDVDCIFDKNSILSHLYHEQNNPYTKAPLTIELMEEHNKQDDVKNKISDFNTKLNEWKQTVKK